MCSLINKQLLLTAYAYLLIMEQKKGQQGSEAMQMKKTSKQDGKGAAASKPKHFASQKVKTCCGKVRDLCTNIFKKKQRTQNNKKIPGVDMADIEVQLSEGSLGQNSAKKLLMDNSRDGLPQPNFPEICLKEPVILHGELNSSSQTALEGTPVQRRTIAEIREAMDRSEVKLPVTTTSNPFEQPTLSEFVGKTGDRSGVKPPVTTTSNPFEQPTLSEFVDKMGDGRVAAAWSNVKLLRDYRRQPEKEKVSFLEKKFAGLSEKQKSKLLKTLAQVQSDQGQGEQKTMQCLLSDLLHADKKVDPAEYANSTLALELIKVHVTAAVATALEECKKKTLEAALQAIKKKYGDKLVEPIVAFCVCVDEIGNLEEVRQAILEVCGEEGSADLRGASKIEETKFGGRSDTLKQAFAGASKTLRDSLVKQLKELNDKKKAAVVGDNKQN